MVWEIESDFADRMLRRMTERLVCLLPAFSVAAICAAAEPAKTMNTIETNKTELATFGGGCFWCMDAVFERVPGVKSVTCGYAGGHTQNPTYEQVCSHTTGHAEVVQIEFDPQQTSYEKLLEVFWDAHDPTTMNRQGADAGTQYRSIILCHDDAQKLAAEKSRQQAAWRFTSPIVTEIVPLKKFYPAEEYHQHYFAKNPNVPYCQVVIRPKLEKLKAKEEKH